MTQLSSIIEKLFQNGITGFTGFAYLSTIIHALEAKPTGKQNDFLGSDSYPGHSEREYITPDGSLIWVRGVCDQPGDFSIEINHQSGDQVQIEGTTATGVTYALELTFDKDASAEETAAVIKGVFGPDTETADRIWQSGRNPIDCSFQLSIRRHVGIKKSRYLSNINGSCSSGDDPLELLPRELRGQIQLTRS